MTAVTRDNVRRRLLTEHEFDLEDRTQRQKLDHMVSAVVEWYRARFWDLIPDQELCRLAKDGTPSEILAQVQQPGDQTPERFRSLILDAISRFRTLIFIGPGAPLAVCAVIKDQMMRHGWGAEHRTVAHLLEGQDQPRADRVLALDLGPPMSGKIWPEKLMPLSATLKGRRRLTVFYTISPHLRGEIHSQILQQVETPEPLKVDIRG